MPSHEQYLGDGLYCSFDGWQIRLRAPRDGGDHYVYLEPEVYAALTQYVDSVKRRRPSSPEDAAEDSP